ncbi:MAG: hypothetical protein PF541_03750 [Prolixibacteraceae bacterium]|jgi:hypothetical protein|nr:hypothetical protein [Prolixibacteraceae bacterium]
MHKKLAVLFLLLAIGILSMAQAYVSVQTEVGRNQVSNGSYINLSGIGAYNFKGNILSVGLQNSSLSTSTNIITDYFIAASKDLQVKKKPFQLELYFLQSNFSSIIRETNWGLKAKIEREHYELTIGNNFKTYAYSKQAQNNYSITENTRIHENWNLLYTYTYYLKPVQNEWNVSATICNYDHFIIYQPTNPIFNLKGKYELAIPIELFAELWYKSVGVFNLNVNYFGYFIRGGIVWRIE